MLGVYIVLWSPGFLKFNFHMYAFGKNCSMFQDDFPHFYKRRVDQMKRLKQNSSRIQVYISNDRYCKIVYLYVDFKVPYT